MPLPKTGCHIKGAVLAQLSGDKSERDGDYSVLFWRYAAWIAK